MHFNKKEFVVEIEPAAITSVSSQKFMDQYKRAILLTLLEEKQLTKQQFELCLERLHMNRD